MTRTEDNKEILDFIKGKCKETKEGTFEELVVFHLGTMNTLLTDISKSLAIIADGEKRVSE